MTPEERVLPERWGKNVMTPEERMLPERWEKKCDDSGGEDASRTLGKKMC